MTPPLPSVSVVIPCRGGSGTLAAQLAALASQDYQGPLEVIVVDNGSTDGSAAVARRAGVRVIDASTARGPNHARNAGAAAASGDLILTCDADDVVDVGWVHAMAAGLAEYDLVGGTLEYSQLNSEGIGWTPPRFGLEPRFAFLPTASGSSFGIRARVLADLGGWDESFDGGPDDLELCWRAQLAGYRLGHAPDAVVHYRLRSTAPALATQAFRGGLRIPQLIRRFRRAGMPYRGILDRALRIGGYVAFAWPLAVVSRRHRLEWVRRSSLAAGFAVGLFRRPPIRQILRDR